MLKVVPQVLPSLLGLFSYLSDPAPGRQGAQALICAPCIDISCCGILLVIVLGVGASCWLILGVV